MNKTGGFTIVEMLVALVLVAAFSGWVMNIYQISSMSFDNFTPMLVLRFIGIFVAPLGAVLGYI
jgi:prepilin-type N-terminal cleavage/methylation domain-containing protein